MNGPSALLRGPQGRLAPAPGQSRPSWSPTWWRPDLNSPSTTTRKQILLLRSQPGVSFFSSSPKTQTGEVTDAGRPCGYSERPRPRAHGAAVRE